MRGGRFRTLGVAVALAAASMSTTPSLARGADDAGTRSAFALGAGGRAIGLGGAYTAVPGDATIAAWNAGGLGWITRGEAYAGAAQYPMEIREDYVSVVLPSWRWGTIGLSMRRLGTNGIEGRDERNVVTGTNLGSAESEIAVSYGRPISATWSLGGTVKMQRQSLAGFSGSGLGADLGVTGYPFAAMGVDAPWASRVTWGFALRNVIQPSIRLDEESVRDPGLWRTGFGYRTLFGLATLDLEKGSGSAPRVRAGAEFSPHAMLALRGGMNSGALAAGAGFRLRGISIDYAFENRAFDPVHRVGISYAFGATVSERREAAARAEEERLQTRLVEAFQRAQGERVQALLVRAREARAAGRFPEALEVLGTLLTLEPSQPEATDLEIACLRDHAASLERTADFPGAIVAYSRILDRLPSDAGARAGRSRCQLESDRRAARTAERRKAFARAMDAFAADNLPAARTAFEAILRETPQDEEVQAMLRRTREALSRRAEGLLRDARRSLDAGALDAAAASIDQARALDPAANGLDAAAGALQRARSAAAAARPVDVPRPAAGHPKLTPEQEREVRELYARGVKAMEDRRPFDAVRYFELIWNLQPEFERTKEYLKREHLLLGLDAYSNGRLDEAVTYWERALTVDPADARARGYLARAQKQLERSREILGESR